MCSLLRNEKIILHWQSPLWEGDQEIAKIYGGGETMWVVIHKCMEAMLRISLYSYLHLKVTKTIHLSYYLLCFLFSKVREEG
jgi:hypothetical protein